MFGSTLSSEIHNEASQYLKSLNIKSRNADNSQSNEREIKSRNSDTTLIISDYDIVRGNYSSCTGIQYIIGLLYRRKALPVELKAI